MKKLMKLAAVLAVSFVALSSQATVDCTKSKKDSLYPKRDWSAYKNGPAVAKAPVKAVATKTATKKAVR